MWQHWRSLNLPRKPSPPPRCDAEPGATPLAAGGRRDADPGIDWCHPQRQGRSGAGEAGAAGRCPAAARAGLSAGELHPTGRCRGTRPVGLDPARHRRHQQRRASAARGGDGQWEWIRSKASSTPPSSSPSPSPPPRPGLATGSFRSGPGRMPGRCQPVAASKRQLPA